MTEITVVFCLLVLFLWWWMIYKYYKISKLLSRTLDHQKGLIKHVNILYERSSKLIMAAAIMKIDCSYPIQRTVIDILHPDSRIKINEVYPTFLKYLFEEYTKFKEDLIKKIEDTSDESEQKRLQNIFNEIENILILLSTVSDESSLIYVEQIFDEIITGVKKIKNFRKS